MPYEGILDRQSVQSLYGSRSSAQKVLDKNKPNLLELGGIRSGQRMASPTRRPSQRRTAHAISAGDAQGAPDTSGPVPIDPAEPEAKQPALSPWATKLLTLNIAAVLPLFIGLCYFYDRAYRLAYFGPFGLDPDAVPITVQDAIVDGFLGIAAHVLWLVMILAGLALCYATIVWLAGWYGVKLANRLGIPDRRGAPPEVLAAFSQSGGVRLTLLVTGITFGGAMMCAIALFLVGIPADRAGRNDGKSLREVVESTKAQCARYDLVNGKFVVGRLLAGAADRQFVLGSDNMLHVVKYEDLAGLQQSAVRCQATVKRPPKTTPSPQDH